MGRYEARSRVPPSDWLWAAPFLTVGLLMTGLMLFVAGTAAGAALSGEPVPNGLWFFSLVCLLFAVAFTAGGLTTLSKVTRIAVDASAGRLVLRNGRPFLPKTREEVPLAGIRKVWLSREDVHTSSSKSPFGKSKRYRRHWRVSAGGPTLFDDTREGVARRLAERIAAAADAVLIDETGDTPVLRLPADLDRPLLEKLAAGELNARVPAEAAETIERDAGPGWIRYRGRVGFVGRWTLAIASGAVCLRSGPLGAGFARRVPADRIELIQVDERLRTKTRTFFSRSKDEQDVVRIVTDEAVLEVPVNDGDEARWLSARLLADLAEIAKD